MEEHAHKQPYADLQEWNNDLVRQYAWNPVFFGLFFTIGIFGNVVVIMIYKFKMTKKMEERYFIPVLAVIDLFACFIICCFALLQSVQPLTIADSSICKVFGYLQYAGSSSTLFMLLSIAVQRYRMVCDPFGRQMSMGMKRTAICLSVVFAYFLFVPNIFLMDIVDVKSNKTGLVGHRCAITIDNYVDKTLLFTFRVFLLLIFLLVIIIMSILYTLIAKTISNRTTNVKRSIPTSTSSDNAIRKLSFSGTVNVLNPEIKVHTTAFDSIARGKKRRHFLTYRYSYMFMTITITAVLSYIVPLIFALISGSSGKDVHMSLTFFIAKRLHIICHIVNPFIYGAFDMTFRNHILEIVYRCVRKREHRRDRTSNGQTHSSTS